MINNTLKNKDLIKSLVKKIQGYNEKPIKIMEVCGTHTMAIAKYGIRSLLPKNIELISGPGCPVCVTSNYFIKSAIELSRLDNIIIATFGDLMRIPVDSNSLLLQKSRGSSIVVVYSPLDCIEIAKFNPTKTIVFLSVGFETTTPVVALLILNAIQQGINNIKILSANKTISQPLKIISSDKDIAVDAYIYPGHVSSIIGEELYLDIANNYGIPGVITGFEPIDILAAINRIANDISQNNITVTNFYSSVVKKEGNKKALETMNKVFEAYSSTWRGIGQIPKSGMKLKKDFDTFDAWELFGGEFQDSSDEPKDCRCGDILKGKCSPINCKLFSISCTPETPVGACMVSSEGTCAAFYKYSNLNA